jgi:hypothetical protein
LSGFVDLAPDVFVGEQVAEEDRAADAADLVERLVGWVPGTSTGEERLPAQRLLLRRRRAKALVRS